jgi:hypothetical protein
MSITVIGPIFVTVATFGFGLLLFRGMVLEWHRRDRETRGSAS